MPSYPVGKNPSEADPSPRALGIQRKPSAIDLRRLPRIPRTVLRKRLKDFQPQDPEEQNFAILQRNWQVTIKILGILGTERDRKKLETLREYVEGECVRSVDEGNQRVASFWEKIFAFFPDPRA